MRKYVIMNGARCGFVTVRPAKSELHRRLIAAALCPQPTRLALRGFEMNDDNRATREALLALGWLRVLTADSVQGCDPALLPVTDKQLSIDCGQSGTTLRFLLPLVLLAGQKTRFTGQGRLFQRPLEPFLQQLREHGACCCLDDDGLSVSGKLSARAYRLPAHLSSQFASSLLLALPLCAENSRLHFPDPPASRAYIDLTLEVLRGCGVEASWQNSCCLEIPGRQQYRPNNAPLAGDYSQAAFFLAAGALSGPVSVQGLAENSLQADAAIVQHLTAFGARVTRCGNCITVSRGECRPLRVNVDPCPDLAPVLAVLAAAAEGVSVLSGAGRLRYKESDRLQGLVSGLTALGAEAECRNDELIIHGHGQLTGGWVEDFGDHRLAMAWAVAAAICKHPVVLPDAAVTAKSAPEFPAQYASLRVGGDAYADLG